MWCVFTCCTGGAAGSISRNLPAVHVSQTNIWVQTHVKVITADRQVGTVVFILIGFQFIQETPGKVIFMMLSGDQKVT